MQNTSIKFQDIGQNPTLINFNGGDSVYASKTKKPRYFTSWEDVPIILDIATSALILGIPYDSVRKLIREGTIPASKIGKLWRITKEALMEYLGVKPREVPCHEK